MDLGLVMEWTQKIFATPFVMLLISCGAWSVFMAGTALEEQQLQREAKLSKRLGWLYMGLGAAGFLASKLSIFLYPQL